VAKATFWVREERIGVAVRQFDAESTAHGTVDQLAQQISVPVVARVLFNEMDVDPSQRTRLTSSGSGVVQTMKCGGLAAGVALGVKHRQIGSPVGVVEGNEFTIVNRRIEPDW
jgi:hypothetical protein